MLFRSSILIVDDQTNNLKVISSVLGEKYRLFIANSGEKALKILEIANPDIILLDVMMPGMSGFEVCEKIKNSNSQIANIPIIFLTAKTDIDDIINGFDLGAVDYITKPFNIKEVRARIETQIKLSDAINTIKEQKQELEIKNNLLLDAQEELTRRNEDLTIAYDAVEKHAYNVNVLNQKLIESEHTLKEKNEQLTEANNEKDKFFSILAHDLKSPFSGLIGLLKMLYEDSYDFSEDEKSEIIRLLYETSKNVYSLLENLLEWSRLKRGLTDFNPQLLSPKEILISIIQLVNSNVKLKEIEIIDNIPEEITINADSLMINTVLRNLVSNALKFTNKNGKIIVKASKSDDETVVSVNDTGIGMDDEMKDNLFKIAKKITRPGTEGEKSTGLGLILCSELIKKHNGKIWAESEVGKGTTIYFSIP